MNKEQALSIVKADGFDIDNMTSEQEEAVSFLHAIEQNVEKNKLYLKNTDWYYARKLEINEDVPVDVVNKRTEARNYLRANGY